MSKQPSYSQGLSFAGRTGKSRLRALVEHQTLVTGNKELAALLVAAGEVERHSKGEFLSEQGDHDNDVMLLISGEVSVRVNDREVARRSAGTHVGEMALVDALAKRSATLVAVQETVVLRISERKFSAVADKNPDLWRRIAVEVSRRLRERNISIQHPNPKPVVFVGSSSEGLKIATAIGKSLKDPSLLVKLWTDGVFQPSSTSIESLMAVSRDSDFAILVLRKDDLTTSRGATKRSPRDNVIFELGLLMGAIGRERVFLLRPSKTDLKLPSDISGVTCVDYPSGGATSFTTRFKPACRTIRALISTLGPR